MRTDHMDTLKIDNILWGIGKQMAKPDMSLFLFQQYHT